MKLGGGPFSGAGTAEERLRAVVEAAERMAPPPAAAAAGGSTSSGSDCAWMADFEAILSGPLQQFKDLGAQVGGWMGVWVGEGVEQYLVRAVEGGRGRGGDPALRAAAANSPTPTPVVATVLRV